MESHLVGNPETEPKSFLFGVSPQFVVVLQKFHVVEQCQKLSGMVFTRFHSRFIPMLAGLRQVVWQVVKLGSDLGPITSE